METMRSIVLMTCVISLLTGVLDALKPNERFDRQMRLLLSAVFLMAILTPLAKGLKTWEPNWNSEVEASAALSTALETQTQECAAANLEATLTELLQRGGVTDAIVQVEMHTTADGCIEINRVTAFCTDQETAKVLLADCLGEEVTVYVEETP